MDEGDEWTARWLVLLADLRLLDPKAFEDLQAEVERRVEAIRVTMRDSHGSD